MTAMWARLRWWVTFRLSLLIIALARFVPTSFAYAIANPVSYVAYRICGKERRGIESNLRHVLPEGEALRETREVFRNFGRYLIDFYQLPTLGKDALCHRMDFHQWRELHQAFDEGNGTIIVTLHLGQAELGAGALSAYEHPVSVIAEKLEDARMNEFIQGLRQRLGMKIIPAKSAKPGVLRCLNRGEVLGLMFDAVEPGEGLETRFFGGAAEFSGTPARIAVRTGARILPAIVARDPLRPERLIPVIDFDFHFVASGDDDADVRDMTQAIAESFEGMVARYPGQWFAFRPVWRETPARMSDKPATKGWMEWSLRISVALGGRMPRSLAYFCARLAGDVAYRLRPNARADVEDNMRHVMGTEADQNAVDRNVREVFRNVARYYADLIRLPQTPPKTMVERLVEIRGLENLKEPTSKGQGAVVVTAHFGNPEAAVQVGAILGFDVLVLAEPLSPPSFDEMMTKLRATHGVRYEDVSFSAVSNAIRHLRKGGVLAIICDRDIQGTGTPLEFFGQPAKLPLGAAELAARTGAALIPGYSKRTARGFEIVFEEAIEMTKTGDRDADARINAEKVLRVAESWIRSDPGQWMVLERIWKPLPPGVSKIVADLPQHESPTPAEEQAAEASLP